MNNNTNINLEFGATNSNENKTQKNNNVKEELVVSYPKDVKNRQEVKSQKLIKIDKVTSDTTKLNKTNIKKIKPKTQEELLYETRDLSTIKFNERVLSMACNENVPLMERLKYLSITSSNIDEFTMVRVSKILDRDEKNPHELSIMGTTPKQQYKSISNKIEKFLNKQNKVLREVLTDLQAEGIFLIRNKKELTKKGHKFVKKYFQDKVQSALTPLVFDNARPFPLISNNALYLGVMIDNNGTNIFGTIKLPDLDRVIEIKDDLPEGIREFILLEDVIRLNLDKIFVNKKISKTCVYRVLRNFDYSVTNESSVFLADEIKETLKRREVNDVVRLDISGNKKEFTEVLYNALNISKHCINKTNGIVDLTFGFQLANIKLSEADEERMTYKPFTPYLDKALDEFDIFDSIERGDIVLHHPYDSYDTVLKFIEQASEDNDVVAIKQTLYRVSNNSPIMKALINAAENGKHVTVLLEVKARFDEENNIHWANKLEAAGGHVIYGVPGMKTHCKLCLVVKKTKKGILEKFAHVGTGNYNEKNAKIYTDISLLTKKTSITNDVESLFNYLTGFSDPQLSKIIYSPNTLQQSILSMIDTEINNAKNNIDAEIVIKVNGLTDKVLCDKLYEAAEKGVKVHLIVRTSCAMVKTDNPNLKITSVVGRFLEHSRIYYFKNATDKELYFISSADLMERNLYHRVEVAVPVTGKAKYKIAEILNVYKKDETCFILEDYKYVQKKKGESCQDIFMNRSITLSTNQIENKIFSRMINK